MTAPAWMTRRVAELGGSPTDAPELEQEEREEDAPAPGGGAPPWMQRRVAELAGGQPDPTSSLARRDLLSGLAAGAPARAPGAPPGPPPGPAPAQPAQPLPPLPDRYAGGPPPEIQPQGNRIAEALSKAQGIGPPPGPAPPYTPAPPVDIPPEPSAPGAPGPESLSLLDRAKAVAGGMARKAAGVDPETVGLKMAYGAAKAAPKVVAGTINTIRRVDQGAKKRQAQMAIAGARNVPGLLDTASGASGYLAGMAEKAGAAAESAPPTIYDPVWKPAARLIAKAGGQGGELRALESDLGQAAEELRKALSPKQRKDVLQRLKEQPLSTAAELGIENIHSLGTTALAFAAAGPAGALSAGFLQEASDAYSTAKQDGASEEQSIAAAGLAGAVGMGLEYLPIAKLAKVLKAPRRALEQAIKGIASQAAAEAATEGLQEVAQMAAAAFTYLAESGSEWSALKDQIVSREGAERIVAAVVAGAVLGGGAGAAGAGGAEPGPPTPPPFPGPEPSGIVGDQELARPEVSREGAIPIPTTPLDQPLSRPEEPSGAVEGVGLVPEGARTPAAAAPGGPVPPPARAPEAAPELLAPPAAPPAPEPATPASPPAEQQPPPGAQRPQEDDTAPDEWWTRRPDTSGQAAYVVVVRGPNDPERSSRPEGGRKDKAPHRSIAKVDPDEWADRIVEQLREIGEPATFNHIGVEMLDQTADMLFQTNVEEGLWRAVDRGDLEYTPRRPVLFRPRERPEPPAEPVDAMGHAGSGASPEAAAREAGGTRFFGVAPGGRIVPIIGQDAVDAPAPKGYAKVRVSPDGDFSVESGKLSALGKKRLEELIGREPPKAREVTDREPEVVDLDQPTDDEDFLKGLGVKRPGAAPPPRRPPPLFGSPTGSRPVAREPSPQATRNRLQEREELTMWAAGHLGRVSDLQERGATVPTEDLDMVARAEEILSGPAAETLKLWHQNSNGSWIVFQHGKTLDDLLDRVGSRAEPAVDLFSITGDSGHPDEGGLTGSALGAMVKRRRAARPKPGKSAAQVQEEAFRNNPPKDATEAVLDEFRKGIKKGTAERFWRRVSTLERAGGDPNAPAILGTQKEIKARDRVVKRVLAAEKPRIFDSYGRPLREWPFFKTLSKDEQAGLLRALVEGHLKVERSGKYHTLEPGEPIDLNRRAPEEAKPDSQVEWAQDAVKDARLWREKNPSAEGLPPRLRAAVSRAADIFKARGMTEEMEAALAASAPTTGTEPPGQPTEGAGAEPTPSTPTEEPSPAPEQAPSRRPPEKDTSEAEVEIDEYKASRGRADFHVKRDGEVLFIVDEWKPGERPRVILDRKASYYSQHHVPIGPPIANRRRLRELLEEAARGFVEINETEIVFSEEYEAKRHDAQRFDPKPGRLLPSQIGTTKAAQFWFPREGNAGFTNGQIIDFGEKGIAWLSKRVKSYMETGRFVTTWTERQQKEFLERFAKNTPTPVTPAVDAASEALDGKLVLMIPEGGGKPSGINRVFYDYFATVYGEGIEFRRFDRSEKTKLGKSEFGSTAMVGVFDKGELVGVIAPFRIDDLSTRAKELLEEVSGELAAPGPKRKRKAAKKGHRYSDDMGRGDAYAWVEYRFRDLFEAKVQHSPEAKKLYLKLVGQAHPDLQKSDQEKARGHEFLIAAKDAYERIGKRGVVSAVDDVAELRRLLDAWHAGEWPKGKRPPPPPSQGQRGEPKRESRRDQPKGDGPVGSQPPPRRGAAFDPKRHKSAILEMPEMVELLQSLAGTKGIPIRIRKSLGHGVLGHFMPRGGRPLIELIADLAQDPKLAARVMAHEIGHWVDFYGKPDSTMARGNVLGRLATLKGYLKHMLDEEPADPSRVLTADEQKAMRREAQRQARSEGLKGVDANLRTRDLYRQAVQRAMEERGLVDKDTVRAEMVELSKMWRGDFSPQNRYRNSGVELYADLFSALVNDPDLTASIAPSTMQLWFNYLSRKPAVEETYASLVERIELGRFEVLKGREERLRAAARRGIALSWKARSKLKVPRKMTDLVRDALGILHDHFWDAKGPALRLAKKAREMGLTERARDLVHAMEEMAYENPANVGFVADVFFDVWAVLRGADIDTVTLSSLLQTRRAGTERAGIWNPRAVQGEAARELYQHVLDGLGQERAQAFQDAMQAWWGIRRDEVIEVFVESGMATPALAKKMRENPNYARIVIDDILKAQIDNEGLSGDPAFSPIKRQVGTVKDTGDMFLETLSHDLSLRRTAWRNTRARLIVEMLQAVEPGSIYRAKRGPNGRYQHRSSKGKLGSLETIYWYEDGKMQAAHVPLRYAQMIDSWEDTHLFSQVWQRSFGNAIRAILVTRNPGWAAWNLQRDFLAFTKNVVRGDPLSSAVRAADAMVRTFGATWKLVVQGELTPLVRDALKEKAILAPQRPDYSGLGEDPDLDELALDAMSRYGILPAESKKQKNLLRRFVDGLTLGPGEFTERWVKLAGYEYLKRAHPELTAAERAHSVRTRVGTPDVYRRGRGQHWTNALFLFSNVNKEGLRTSLEVIKERPVEYVVKTMTYSVLTNLALQALARELIGAAFDDWYERIPENDKRNYLVVPIYPFFDEKKRAIYGRIPHDHMGQLVTIIGHEILEGFDEGFETAEIIDVLMSASPWGFATLHPVIEAAGGMVVAFGLNWNPRDFYYGSNVVDERVHQAAMEPGALQKEARAERRRQVYVWAWRQAGGRVFYDWQRRPSLRKEEPGSPGWWNSPYAELPGGGRLPVPLVGPLVQRFVKVSDQGLSEVGREHLEQLTVEAGEPSTNQVAWKREQIVQKLLETDPELNPDKSRDVRRLRKALAEAGVDYKSFTSAKKALQRQRERLLGGTAERTKSYFQGDKRKALEELWGGEDGR